MERNMTQHRVLSRDLALAVLLVGSLIAPSLVAREHPASSAAAPAVQPRRGAAQGPTVTSPEVRRDRRVTFRTLAPAAQKVELRSPGDIPGVGGRGAALPQLTKNADGIWEATFGPLPAGAYRYVFVVDGLTVVDARNPATSQTNTTVYSLAVVPGSDLFDTKNVPHGAVAAVHYNSTALGGIRRMHIYTPPGYEAGRDRYPVFYLLHGAGDVDDSWTSVGRAGFILDNLIASGKAKPMIVVMPAGHVNGAGKALGAPPPATPVPVIPAVGQPARAVRRSMGEGEPGLARQCREQARPARAVVQHRQGRRADHHHAQYRRSSEEARLHAGLPRERRGAYLVELARLPDRVRAA